MYSFEYDHLERLSDSRHYLNASPSNSLEEKDITYDLNSNMLTTGFILRNGGSHRKSCTTIRSVTHIIFVRQFLQSQQDQLKRLIDYAQQNNVQLNIVLAK